MMVDVWYINTASISPMELSKVNRLLPDSMLEEIRRFRFHEDRRLKTLGRALVRTYFEQNDATFNWNDWGLDQNGKPQVKEKDHFNVSHSGDIVMVAFSQSELGVDVEKYSDVDVTSITSFLHSTEQSYIQHATNLEDAFYTIWTRKEAYLKARGVGIVQGLDSENCLESTVGIDKKWYINNLSLSENYKAALCTECENPTIRMREFELNEICEL
ncbi:MAG: 4'-phosphopantetheinyl transferase superfamily protein [Crocinitomicaceae bacterium]